MRYRRILVVDENEALRRITQLELEDEGYSVMTTACGDARMILAREPLDLVIADIGMPNTSGIALLKYIRAEYPETAVVLVTATRLMDNAIDATNAGAYHYLAKPFIPGSLRLIVATALEHLLLREEVQALRSTLDQKVGFENIIGHSKALLYALETAARAAQSDVTVLLSGETGTGKEMIARGIHHCSSRKTMPFVTIDCGAITRGTLEPEWFGHIADIRTAVGGTVFLDEVGDLSLEVQVKLLDLLQQYQTATATETARITHDVRIIAASNRNLLSMVQRGTFREDLFYRLNVVPIDVPPLRERTEDIAELTQHFFAITREKHARQHLRLPSLLLPYLLAYLWPGNVRELENLIERFAAVAPNDEVGLDDLPEAIRRARPVIETLRVPLPARGLNLESVERDLMLRALIMCKWNQSQAARYLDVSCKTLIGRMEKFGLEPA